MKIGYVADRSGLISVKEQTALLVAYGVAPEHIYNADHGLDAAVSSCDRGGDELVVHSAIVIGAHAYPRTVKLLAKQKAFLYVDRKTLLIDCAAGEGVADGALDIKDYHAATGKKVGREKKISNELALKIMAYVYEGNTQKAAVEKYASQGANASNVSRIMNNKYFISGVS